MTFSGDAQGAANQFSYFELGVIGYIIPGLIVSTVLVRLVLILILPDLVAT